MTSARRYALGALAFSPIVAVVAFAVFLVVQRGSSGADDDFAVLLLLAIHWKVLAAIVVLRLVVGLTLAVHAWRHLVPAESGRAIWSFRLVFFTEMRAPQYWLEHVR